MISSTSRASLAVAAIAACLLAAGAADAETIYKAVDESGEVVYSDTPPSGIVGAHRMEVAPSPSEEEQRQGAENRDRLLRAADIEGKYSAKKAPAKQIRDTQRRLDEARERLKRYEVVQDDDWAGTQSGTRSLKGSYYARVEGAKGEIADLESELKDLQIGR